MSAHACGLSGGRGGDAVAGEAIDPGAALLGVRAQLRMCGGGGGEVHIAGRRQKGGGWRLLSSAGAGERLCRGEAAGAVRRGCVEGGEAVVL